MATNKENVPEVKENPNVNAETATKAKKAVKVVKEKKAKKSDSIADQNVDEKALLAEKPIGNKRSAISDLNATAAEKVGEVKKALKDSMKTGAEWQKTESFDILGFEGWNGSVEDFETRKITKDEFDERANRSSVQNQVNL